MKGIPRKKEGTSGSMKNCQGVGKNMEKDKGKTGK